MTAKDALDAANDAALGERLRRFESRCGPRGSCRREPCERDAGRWSFCPDCLTGDLYLNESIFLAHVPREIWRYELGGYPVLKKWSVTVRPIAAITNPSHSASLTSSAASFCAWQHF
jgi:Type ISP C-terminal specificity domain